MSRSPLRFAFVLATFVLLTVFSSSLLSARPVGALEVNDTTAACNPGAKQVAFFEHEAYGGRCRKLNIGSYPNAVAFKLPDNLITSLKVGSQVRTVLFRDKDYKGFSAAYETNVSNLYYEPIGNDTVSSLKVELKEAAKCKAGPYQVALYEHEQYGGRCIVKELGGYADELEIGLPEDFITSFKVGSKVRVILYRGEDFDTSEYYEAYQTNIPNLFYEPIRNDTVSSLRVERRATNKPGQCIPKPYQVAFFEHEQFKGQCIVKDLGEYPGSFEIGLPDNFITAIKVGSKVKVVAYQNNNFGGSSATYTKNVKNLFYEPIGNDTISSVKIMTR